MTCPRSVRETVSDPGKGARFSELLGAPDAPEAAGHIPGTGNSEARGWAPLPLLWDPGDPVAMAML